MTLRSKFVLVILLMLLANAVHGANRLDPELLTKAQRDGKVRVMVWLREANIDAVSADPTTQASHRVKATTDALLARLPEARDALKRRFALVPALALEADVHLLNRLQFDPEVLRIDEDGPGSGHAAADAASVLNGVSQLAALGWNGAGTKVAVIDSGVDTDHPDLQSRLIGEQCFCTGCCPGGQSTRSGTGAAEDDNGHGTNVAGIMVGTGNVAPIGALPAAELVAIKVLDSQSSFCCTSDVVAALDWVAVTHPDIDVVNLSLGTNASYVTHCDNVNATTQSLARAVSNIEANGGVVVASTGNQGNSNASQAPACVENVVSVAATWDFSGGARTFLGCTETSTEPKKPTCFSNRSVSTDLYAAGAFVTAPGRGGGSSSYGGTSQAAPMVAACAAALQQAVPAATVSQRKSAINLAPTSVVDVVSGRSYPFLDCVAAAQTLADVAGPEALLTSDQYLWMVPAADNTEQQGFLRLINRDHSAGQVTVWGLDASGQRSAGTITLTLSALETRQFNSQDLEQGNTSKGLTGSLGTGSGHWTIIVRSDLDLETLAYIRTPDGFLTSMHDRVEGDGTDWPVPFFNPAENVNQVSRLRLINTNTSATSIQITGIDDAGAAGSGTVTVTLPTLSSIDLTSSDLENGNPSKGLSGSLGNGTGKWQLRVSATARLTVQSLLYDPLGKLTNLSSLPDLTQTVPNQRVLWLVPPASNTAQQGFIRLINRENRSGSVTLRGVDDTGQLSPGTASFSLGANASAQFNSQDLERGNASKGLIGSLGVGSGNWRLQVTTDLNLWPMALIRTPDGFLTTVHEVVAGNGLDNPVVIFNPAENPNQVSSLRLVNPNSVSVAVSIEGIDDAGQAGPGGSITLSLAAGAAKELTATDLESGNTGKGLSGALGNGSGKWRLNVQASAPIKVMSLLNDPRGFLTNLSSGSKDSSDQLEP